MDQDRLARYPLQLAGRSHAHSEKHLIDDGLTSILRRYSRGEISAERAADKIGATYNVGDVYVLLREAELPLPKPDNRSNGQFERAKCLFANVS